MKEKAGQMELFKFSNNANENDFEKIARRFNLRMILAFGSAVSTRVHPQSDVDIAVLCKKPDLSMEKYSDLLFELQKLIPEREVDLAVINQADPLFLKKIMERNEILYGKESDLARLKIYAFKRYVDHRKYFRMEEEFARRFIARYAGEAGE
ncbi:MAG: nucleotidyltransferase domain-containing protein [Actinomycetota bacterium]|nr:nucleotidyltransferase domain-containing protein [Actinomycetota bacterium]